jgi:hypothetical protein
LPMENDRKVLVHRLYRWDGFAVHPAVANEHL